MCNKYAIDVYVSHVIYNDGDAEPMVLGLESTTEKGSFAASLMQSELHTRNVEDVAYKEA